MKRRSNRLSATFVKTVNVPGRYGDGRGGLGLSLLVKPASRNGFNKSWGQSVRIDGKKTTLGLGRYPVVTLAMARERALANARVIAQGRDPRRFTHGVPTFASACEKVIAIHAEGWSTRGKSEHQWRASLRDYAMQRLGAKRVDEIDTADVMAVLLPIWSTKRETARRVRQRIGAVMKWAVAQGYRNDNPAGDAIAAALPKSGVKREHLPALHHTQVATALDRVRRSDARPVTVFAFEFLVLTACRSGEVRSARWEEVDRARAVWTIPAERMKAGREHRVPLSAQAIGVLDRARRLSGNNGGLVFPSRSGRIVSQATLPALLRGLEIGAVPHGFRSSFRDWAAECTDVPREVCELALAHVNNDRVEAAYRRSDLFEKRRLLMAAWANYITTAAEQAVSETPVATSRRM